MKEFAKGDAGVGSDVFARHKHAVDKSLDDLYKPPLALVGSVGVHLDTLKERPATGLEFDNLHLSLTNWIYDNTLYARSQLQTSL